MAAGRRAVLRILVFNPSYPPVPCGVGDYVWGLAEALTRAGHDVTVITAAGATNASQGPPRVLPLLRNWDVIEFLRAWRHFARPWPQIVVSGFPAVVTTSRSRLLYLVPGLAKLTLRRPRTVYVVHEFIRTGDTERRRLRLALSTADRIIAVTEAERDAIVTRYSSTASRTIVRHNPPTIPIARWDTTADRSLRDSLALAGRPLIAYFGFLWSAAKGFEDLLEAIASRDVGLVVTGSLDPVHHPYHAHLVTEIERLGVADRIRWLGFLADDDVARLLRAADIVALPYRGGAQSGYTSLIASLINGAAVITTRGPETPPWLEDERTALLVDPCDPPGLAAAIDRLLADARLATSLRKHACQLAFGWEELVEAVANDG
jgi:glycosyltransferase involved in cell wall biosynthesis